MNRFASLPCVILGLLLSIGTHADWIEDSNVNAMYVLRAQAAFQPEGAANTGLEEYDAEIFDIREGYRERAEASDREVLAELRRRLEDETHPKVREDLEILIRAVEDGIESRRIDAEYMLPYFNLHRSLFFSFNSLLNPQNAPTRYLAALERLKKYNGAEEGYRPITELAMARSGERFDAGLLGPYRVELETDLANTQSFISGIRQAFERAELEGYEADLATLETQLAEYAAWLESEMMPRTRDDNRLPEAVYADNLKNFGVRATPEELIEQGQAAYQFIRSEMKALAWRIAEQRGWEDRRLVPVMRRLKQEQIPQDEILDLYKRRLAEIEAIIRREDIITLPQREAGIRMATEAESASIPASFMRPPRLINNTGEFGEFVLVQSNPALEGEAFMDDWSHDAITWALTVHEARPGHELQFASLVENGTSIARALFAFNSANAEGWGLYAESIMHEYLPLEGQLFNLYTRLLRAARMFVDPMINTGQLSREQALAFLMEQTALSKPMASSEVDRYSFRLPGQATAYYYGYLNLLRLRTEVELVLGDDFDQRAFHDFVLEQGLLPPDLLRQAVLEHFAP